MKLMTARYAGTCMTCSRAITPGDRIGYVYGVGVYCAPHASLAMRAGTVARPVGRTNAFGQRLRADAPSLPGDRDDWSREDDYRAFGYYPGDDR